MGSLLLLNHDSVEPQPGRKVIKATEYAAMIEANEILAAARKRAAQIEEEAHEAYESEKARGYEDGVQEGKFEMAAQMLDNVSRSVDYLEKMEETIVSVVTSSLRTILGEMDAEDRIVGVVKRGLSHVRDQKRITLRVAAEEAETIQSRINEILREYPGIGIVDVVGEPRLDAGGCILETEMGVVDASLDKQLDAMERIFRKQLTEEKAQ